MKEIKAYIKAIKQDEVTRALHRVEGLAGASFSQVALMKQLDFEVFQPMSFPGGNREGG